MPFVYADRVKEQSASLGVGNFILTGAIAGFRTFSAAVGDTNSTYYTITNTDNTWEVGIGTINGVVLSRDTVLSSSNGGVAVNFAAGTKTVFTTATSQLHTNTLTAGTHALLDHAAQLGVPLPEAFDLAAHAAEDHTLQLGVPAAEVFTELAHNDAGFSHAGLPGIPVVGAPSPAAYGINRVSALTLFDLTATTDGIHFLSMDAAGVNLAVMTCNVATAPNDDYPFLVIFNEDFNSKGAAIEVFSLGSTPLVSLLPREGCRLWHTGVTTNEYQVELIVTQNATAAEILRHYTGRGNAANTWYFKIGTWAANTSTPLNPRNHSSPILSPTRFMALGWKSQNSGGAIPVNLSLQDEAEVELEGLMLPGLVVDGVVPLNFSINPVAGAPTNNTKAMNLKFLSGGAKSDTTFAVYGFSRDGGVEMVFAAFQSVGDSNYDLANGFSGPSSFTPISSSKKYQISPTDSLLDRITVFPSTGSTFDVEIKLDGAVAETITNVVTTSGVPLLINLPTPVVIKQGTAVGISISNGAIIAPFPFNFSIIARLKSSIGFVIPFGARLNNGSFLALGHFGDAPSTIANQVPGSFICPVDLRILSISWITESNTGANLELVKEGLTVATTVANVGVNQANFHPILSLTFDAGERLEIRGVGGFSNQGTHALIHATVNRS